MEVLILGATGLVGRSALALAITHPAITWVIAPTRKPLSPNSKLTNPVAEQLELLVPEVLNLGSDAVICALGTTSSKAGSKEAFRQLDYVLPLAFARVQRYLLLSRLSEQTSIPHFSIPRPREKLKGTSSPLALDRSRFSGPALLAGSVRRPVLQKESR